MADILIIDDNDKIRKAYTEILERAGFNVRTCKDGQEGLTEALKASPDLILLDILMPKMNGLEFLKNYAPKQKHPDVKVIALTNIEEPFYKAMELGATDYAVKSDLSVKDIVEIVNKHLGH